MTLVLLVLLVLISLSPPDLRGLRAAGQVSGFIAWAGVVVALAFFAVAAAGQLPNSINLYP